MTPSGTFIFIPDLRVMDHWTPEAITEPPATDLSLERLCTEGINTFLFTIHEVRLLLSLISKLRDFYLNTTSQKKRRLGVVRLTILQRTLHLRLMEV